jgi:toxin YhaV
MDAPLAINGWTILLHPLFLEQVAALVREIQRARTKDPNGYKNRNAAKRLAAVLKLAFHHIPQDPTSRAWLQGSTLGVQHKHWLRAKFFQQYRLFFRCDRRSRVIVYGWVNDAATKRAYGSGTDAYKVFSAMLAKGNPPDDWNGLKAACEADISGAADNLLAQANELLR